MLGGIVGSSMRHRYLVILVAVAFVTLGVTRLHRDGPARRRGFARLRAIPGVRDVGAQVGRAIMSERLRTSTRPRSGSASIADADYDETAGSHPARGRRLPRAVERARSPSPTRGSRKRSQRERDPIVVRLFGPDLEVLRGKAEEVQQAISRIGGIVAPRVEAAVEEPQIEIEVDLEAAERYGIKPGDVRREATTLLAGIEVGNLFEDQKVFEVDCRGRAVRARRIEGIGDLQISTPDGAWIRLGDVADVRLASRPEHVRAHRRVAEHRHHGGGERPRPRRRRRGGRAELGRRAVPARVPCGAARGVRRPGSMGDAAARLRLRRGARHLPASPGGPAQLASRGIDVRRGMLSALFGAVLAAFAAGAALSLGVAGGLVAVLGLAVRGTLAAAATLPGAGDAERRAPQQGARYRRCHGARRDRWWPRPSRPHSRRCRSSCAARSRGSRSRIRWPSLFSAAS